LRSFTMHQLDMRLLITRPSVAVGCSLLVGCMLLSGCGNPSPSVQQSSIAFSPSTCGAAAVEVYDLNHDGLLSADELKACPSIESNVARYDSDGDGQLSADEIAEQIGIWRKLGGSYSPLNCVVLLNGRPLSGAKVELEPEPFFAGALESASGVTGFDGIAAVSAAPESIPEKLRGMPLVQLGLYKVRITHPKYKLPTKYNSETELGCEVSPETADPSKLVQFRLKSP